MVEIIGKFIPLITAIIGGIFGYITTRSANKKDFKLAEKSNEMKFQELKHEIYLKDIELEQLKIEHENELKLKEADVFNPVMATFFADILDDPSNIKKLERLQDMFPNEEKKEG